MFFKAMVTLVGRPDVLGLAGIELTFFTVAGMGLCLRFVLKTVLIIQGCFLLLLSSVYTVKAFSVPYSALPLSELGMHKKLGGDTAQTDDQRDVLSSLICYVLQLSFAEDG